MKNIFIGLAVFFIPFTGLLSVEDGISITILLAVALILLSPNTYINKRTLNLILFAILFMAYGAFVYLLNINHYNWSIHIVLMPIVFLIIFIFLNVHSPSRYFNKALDFSFYTIVAIGYVEFYVVNYLGMDLSQLYFDDRIYEPVGYYGLIRARSTFPESGHYSLFIIIYFLYKLRTDGYLSIPRLAIGSTGIFIAASSAGFASLFLIIMYVLFSRGLFKQRISIWLSLTVALTLIPILFSVLVNDLSVKLDSVSFLERLNSTIDYLGIMQTKDFFIGLGPGFYKQFPYVAPIGIVQIIYLSYGVMGIIVYFAFLLGSIEFKDSVLLAFLILVVILISHTVYGGYYYFFSWFPLFAKSAPRYLIHNGKLICKERIG